MKWRGQLLLAAVLAWCVGQSPAAGQTLGSAASFAILGGSAVSANGTGSLITGDVGVSPGTSLSGFPANATVVPPFATHANDGSAIAAQAAVTALYTTLVGAGPCTSLAMQLNGVTVGPGVYCFSSTADLAATGTLTLDGAGTYIFQVGSGLTANVLSTVLLLNGADPCNVFWQVTSAATLNGTSFVGTVVAQEAVSLGAGTMTVPVDLQGRALTTSTGAVTMAGFDTVGGCSAEATPTATATETATATGTATETATETATATLSASPTSSLTETPSQTATASLSPTPTASASATSTASASATASATGTPSTTSTDSPSPTATATATSTASAIATPSQTMTDTASPTPTATLSQTVGATATASQTATDTPLSTATATGTATSTHTATASASPTTSATLAVTGTSSPTFTATASPTSAATAVATGTGTATVTPTPTVTAALTNTPVATRTRPPIPLLPTPFSGGGFLLVSALGLALGWMLLRPAGGRDAPPR